MKHKGFTLIELLISISIIVILSTIIIANLTDAKKKSRDTKRVSDVAQLQLALELFFERCGQYPTTITDTSYRVASCPAGITWGTFMSTIPKPPQGAGDTDYPYTAKSVGCVSYHLGAHLEDNKNSALGDDADMAIDGQATSNCVSTGSSGDFSGSDTSSNPAYDVIP